MDRIISLFFFRPQSFSLSIRRSYFLARIHIDWQLLTCILLLFTLGLFILYNVKLDDMHIHKQVLRLCIASVMLFCVAQVPPRIFKTLAPCFYYMTLILLCLVLSVGDISKGAQRW